MVGNHANGTLHGTVCRTADGNTLRFGTTTNVGTGLFVPAKVRQHNFSLAYPALDAGSGSELTMESTGVAPTLAESQLLSMHAAYCKGVPIL